MIVLYVYSFCKRDWELDWNCFDLRISGADAIPFREYLFHAVFTGPMRGQWSSYKYRPSHFATRELAEVALNSSIFNYPALSHGMIEGPILDGIVIRDTLHHLTINTERLTT